MKVRLMATIGFDDHRCFVCGHLFELGYVAAVYERGADWVGYVCEACMAIGEQAVRCSLENKADWHEQEARRLREEATACVRVKISPCIENALDYMQQEASRDV